MLALWQTSDTHSKFYTPILEVVSRELFFGVWTNFMVVFVPYFIRIWCNMLYLLSLSSSVTYWLGNNGMVRSVTWLFSGNHNCNYGLKFWMTKIFLMWHMFIGPYTTSWVPWLSIIGSSFTYLFLLPFFSLSLLGSLSFWIFIYFSSSKLYVRLFSRFRNHSLNFRDITTTYTLILFMNHSLIFF